MENSKKFKKLLDLLDEAEGLYGEIMIGNDSTYFIEIEEFRKNLNESINELRKGKLEELDFLEDIFLSNNDWDILTGYWYRELGEKIGILISELKLAREEENYRLAA